MALITLALYLLLVGATILLGLNIPVWVSGVLAIVAGLMLLIGAILKKPL